MSHMLGPRGRETRLSLLRNSRCSCFFFMAGAALLSRGMIVCCRGHNGTRGCVGRTGCSVTINRLLLGSF